MEGRASYIIMSTETSSCDVNWHSFRDGVILTVLLLSIVCLVTSVATMVLVSARIQSKEKEDIKPEVE